MRWPEPPAWLTHERLRSLYLVAALIWLALAIISGPGWIAMMDCFLAGFNVAGALHMGHQIRMEKLFDEMALAFREMSDLNRALIGNRVHVITMEQPDDDSPPLSPGLH